MRRRTDDGLDSVLIGARGWIRLDGRCHPMDDVRAGITRLTRFSDHPTMNG
jgi:hypothetical protein